MSALRRSVNSMAVLMSASSPLEHQLSEVIAAHLRATTGRSASESERRSWQRSLPMLVGDLLDAGLGQLEMLVEYQLPLTSKRADVVLAGVNRRTGEDAFVVVELKQWSHAELFEQDANLVLVDGTPGGPRLHPLAQAQSYRDYLVDYLRTVESKPESVTAVAYLHNAHDRDVADLYDLAGGEAGHMFTKSTRGKLIDFLKDHFAAEPGVDAAERLLGSAIGPSKQLMALAADEIKNREHFVLIGEQRLAFEMVRHAVDKARRSDFKQVVIVTGGPGSGKSAIALSLLGDLSRRGHGVLHATGSKSFTESMRKIAGRGSTRVKTMFKYFNNFMDVERDGIEVLICDEAHRIREKSGTRFTRSKSDRPQVEELLAAARVPVFLLDEHQTVRPGEIGTVEAIGGHARQLGLSVAQVNLDGQFRCGGSRAFEEWVDALLGLGRGEPLKWLGDERFALSVAQSPAELEAGMRLKIADGYSARITAGFCWPWSDPQPDDTLVPDVKVGDWSRPWNTKSDRSVGSAPPSSLWATAEGGFEQVGCVYTAQGFEYDWNGLIIGPDLVARDGRLVTVRSASKDPALKPRTVTDEQADVLIRNTYKVLLTRGMVGTRIFAVDPRTQQFLSELIG